MMPHVLPEVSWCPGVPGVGFISYVVMVVLCGVHLVVLLVSCGQIYVAILQCIGVWMGQWCIKDYPNQGSFCRKDFLASLV